MKRYFAPVAALLFVALGPLGAATAEFHATNGKAPKERMPAQKTATANKPSVLAERNEIVTPPGPAPIIGWLAVKQGLPESELKRQLGFPRIIEGRGDHELWKYVTGAVWVKDHKVVAWIQVILD